MAITTAQQRYLRDRLSSIRNEKPRTYDSLTFPDTTEVKAARKAATAASRVISNFEAKKKLARDKRNAAIANHYDKCLRSINFGDAKEALKALDKFEAMKF